MTWEFALSRKIGLFEMLCADEAYKRFPFGGYVDYVAMSRDGVMRRYNSIESMQALKETIRTNDVAPALVELAKFDDVLEEVLAKDPYEAREEFIRAIENTWIYEIYGYYVAEFTEDQNAIEIGKNLRGTHNAQHEASTHFVPALFAAISEKTGIDIDLIKYATPEEIISTQLDAKVLDSRKSFYLLTLLNKKTSLYIEEAGEAKLEEFDLPMEESVEHSGSVTGTPAFKGNVSGRVCIVNDEADLKKIQDGDVLVSIMTRTTLVSGMKKAAAIVTDEGGVTCHAAIVSRELGKPCVVGTKNATKIFKDGDIVEVDAQSGIVRLK